MSVAHLPEELLTGVLDIDLQHRQWIRTYNDFVEAIENNEGSECILTMLGFLIDYADFHFFCEEKKMDELGYPSAMDHKKKHREMKEKLNSIVDAYRDAGSSPELAAAILSFLNGWLFEHIRSTDVALGKYLGAQLKK